MQNTKCKNKNISGRDLEITQLQLKLFDVVDFWN